MNVFLLFLLLLLTSIFAHAEEVSIEPLLEMQIPIAGEIERSSNFNQISNKELLSAVRTRNCIGLTAKINGTVVGFAIYEMEKNHNSVIYFGVHSGFKNANVEGQMAVHLRQRSGKKAMQVDLPPGNSHRKYLESMPGYTIKSAAIAPSQPESGNRQTKTRPRSNSPVVPKFEGSTHYTTLGVAPDASLAEIQKAHAIRKQLWLTRGQFDGHAIPEIKKLDDALFILGTAERRQVYDASLGEENLDQVLAKRIADEQAETVNVKESGSYLNLCEGIRKAGR